MIEPATLKTSIWTSHWIWDGSEPKPKGVILSVVTKGTYGEDRVHWKRKVKYQDNDVLFQQQVERAKCELLQKMAGVNTNIQAENIRAEGHKRAKEHICDLVRNT